MSSSFAYFTPLVFYVLFLYLVILFFYLIIRRREIQHRIYQPLSQQDHGQALPPIDLQHPYRFQYTTKVEDMINPIFGQNYRLVLLMTRGLSCLYFVLSLIVIITTTTTRSYLWLYLDIWNLVLVTFYFMCTTLLSFLAYKTRQQSARRNDTNPTRWSVFSQILSVTIHMLFELTSVITLMILFSDWMVWNVKDELINASTYLAFLTLLLEMLINQITIRFDQFPCIASLLMLYFFVLWPAAFNGYLHKWPYVFLELNDSHCFANYTLVFVTAWLCSLIWYLVYKSKHTLLDYYQDRMLEEADRATIHLATMVTNELEDEYERGSVLDGGSVAGSSVSGSNSMASSHRSGMYPPSSISSSSYGGFVPSNPYLPQTMSRPPMPMLPPPPQQQHAYLGLPRQDMPGFYPPRPHMQQAPPPPPPAGGRFDPLFNPYVQNRPPQSAMMPHLPPAPMYPPTSSIYDSLPSMQPPPHQQQYYGNGNGASMSPQDFPSIYSSTPSQPQDPRFLPPSAGPERISNPYYEASPPPSPNYTQSPNAYNYPDPTMSTNNPEAIQDISTDPTYVNTIRNQYLSGDLRVDEGSQKSEVPSPIVSESSSLTITPSLKGGLKKGSKSSNAVSGRVNSVSFGVDEFFGEEAANSPSTQAMIPQDVPQQDVLPSEPSSSDN